MEAQIIKPTIKACLAEVPVKLKEAQQTAPAVQACAGVGDVTEAPRNIDGH